MFQRLPIYILIDTSGSMFGEPIQTLRVALETLREDLLYNPHACECAAVSVISFDRYAKVLAPLTGLYDFEVPEIVPPLTAPSNLGEGLQLLLERYEKEVRLGSPAQKGDMPPILVVMTDDAPPTDYAAFKEVAQKIEIVSLFKTPSPGARLFSAAFVVPVSNFKCNYWQALTDRVLHYDGIGMEISKILNGDAEMN